MARARFFAHANVNALDLAASERFYTECFGLRPQGRTAPATTQDGSGFGMAGVPVQWRGVFLADHRDGRGPVVDLLEWIVPPTEGVAYERADHLGLVALRFRAPDLDAISDRLRAEGAAVEQRGGVVVTADPSGTQIEVAVGDGPVTFAGLRVNCTDLARSAAFYQAALGLDTDEVVAADDRVTQELFLPGQRERFSVVLTQWRAGAVGTPYKEGNHAGIYRTALYVDDIDAIYDDLVRVAPDADPPVTVTLGEGLPDVQALFFPDPDGAILEFVSRVA
jgi:catechol 2,3-dioxygenase-like lactoylglutathione lyase family enzyme